MKIEVTRRELGLIISNLVSLLDSETLPAIKKDIRPAGILKAWRAHVPHYIEHQLTVGQDEAGARRNLAENQAAAALLQRLLVHRRRA